MVHSGTSTEVATKQKLQDGKISLQSETLQRFGPPVNGTETTVWLLAVDPGHFRVYPEQEIGNAVDMRAFYADVASLETREERERAVALRMRLIKTTIISGRRLKIPPDLFDVSNEFLDKTHLWLDQSATHLDIYTATKADRAMVIPPTRLAPHSDTE
jgi:hypothetical protein